MRIEHYLIYFTLHHFQITHCSTYPFHVFSFLIRFSYHCARSPGFVFTWLKLLYFHINVWFLLLQPQQSIQHRNTIILNIRLGSRVNVLRWVSLWWRSLPLVRMGLWQPWMMCRLHTCHWVRVLLVIPMIGTLLLQTFTIWHWLVISVVSLKVWIILSISPFVCPCIYIGSKCISRYWCGFVRVIWSFFRGKSALNIVSRCITQWLLWCIYLHSGRQVIYMIWNSVTVLRAMSPCVTLW